MADNGISMRTPAFKYYAILTVALVIGSLFVPAVIPIQRVRQVVPTSDDLALVLPLFVWAILFLLGLMMYRLKALWLLLVGPVSGGLLILLYASCYISHDCV